MRQRIGVVRESDGTWRVIVERNGKLHMRSKPFKTEAEAEEMAKQAAAVSRRVAAEHGMTIQ